MMKLIPIMLLTFAAQILGGCSFVRMGLMEVAARQIPLSPHTQRDGINANGLLYASYEENLTSSAQYEEVAAWYLKYFEKTGWRQTGSRNLDRGGREIYLAKGSWLGKMPVGMAETMVLNVGPIQKPQGRSILMKTGEEVEAVATLQYRAYTTWEMPGNAIGNALVNFSLHDRSTEWLYYPTVFLMEWF